MASWPWSAVSFAAIPPLNASLQPHWRGHSTSSQHTYSLLKHWLTATHPSDCGLNWYPPSLTHHYHKFKLNFSTTYYLSILLITLGKYLSFFILTGHLLFLVPQILAINHYNWHSELCLSFSIFYFQHPKQCLVHRRHSNIYEWWEILEVLQT